MNRTGANQHWLQIMIGTTADQADQFAEALDECGAMAVTMQDNADEPVFEPGPGEQILWSQTNVIGLFSADRNADDIQQQLRALAGLPEPRHIHIKYLADQDWERVWLDNFKPMCFGKRLWVCPEHMQPATQDAIVVRLDPGLAFGTGTHATTAQCLKWLDNHEVAGMTVLDYGCGSGILAIAALLLGARHASAVDIDEQALLACVDNARKNHVEDRLDVQLPDKTITTPVDLLMANILARPLIELAPTFKQLLKPGGTLLISGILTEQQHSVIAAYQDWCRFDDIQIQDNWCCLAGKSIAG